MSRPAPVIAPNSIADQLNWEIDWDTPSGYTSTNEYVRPWDVEGWGSGDVVITPPRNPGGYVPPSRPGIQEGQRDYVFMPTEKEQWRTEDENKRRQAAAVGKDWRESRLPRSVPEEPKEDRREWGESRPDEAYIQVEGPGNPSWERRNPRKPSLRDTLVGAMRRSWR